VKFIPCLVKIALFSLSLAAYPQNNPHTLFISGTVYDQDSLTPVPFVTIMINKVKSALSDQKGNFAVLLFSTDTLTFSVGGFETAMISAHDYKTHLADTVYLEILMRHKPYDLPEATIRPFKEYNDFRTALINMDLENSNLNNNLSRVLSAANGKGYVEWDAYSNYKNTMVMKDLNNNAFIFLSSDPTKGIFGALNSLGIRMPWNKK